jgi:hypothetical protein
VSVGGGGESESITQKNEMANLITVIPLSTINLFMIFKVVRVAHLTDYRAAARHNISTIAETSVGDP